MLPENDFLEKLFLRKKMATRLIFISTIRNATLYIKMDPEKTLYGALAAAGLGEYPRIDEMNEFFINMGDEMTPRKGDFVDGRQSLKYITTTKFMIIENRKKLASIFSSRKIIV